MTHRMKPLFAGLLIAVLSGMLGLLVLTGAGAKQPELPAFLTTATYKTSAKCKMCHKAEHTAWSATKHPAPEGMFPWELEAQKTGKPVVTPAQDVIYRHVTGYDAKANTWAEKGVGCESCHGPGSEHMAAKKEERKAKILNPCTLQSANQQVSVCGRCHGQYTIGDKKFAADFIVGQDLFAIEGFKLDAPKPGVEMQQLNELAQSKHLKNGVTCITCHTSHAETPQAHNLRKPVVAQCTECHKDLTMEKHAPTAAKDATCATCHMAGGRHDFTVPKAE